MSWRVRKTKTFILVYYNSKDGLWTLSWGHPDAFGHYFDKPIAKFATKKAAIEARRREYNERGMFPLRLKRDDYSRRERVIIAANRKKS